MIVYSVDGAHPRSRGENIDHKRISFNASGSSPLTRGKRGDTPPGPAFLGLIPAHAGKTSLSASALVDKRAHPRSRGENKGSDCSPRRSWGSSPLTRGKRGAT